ncbi:MAG: DUF4982 domain-containing protein [Chitinivibrionales bacterium]|nr:DUF4982 domain-containing protein [Chitinivibrionales bacterium]
MSIRTNIFVGSAFLFLTTILLNHPCAYIARHQLAHRTMRSLNAGWKYAADNSKALAETPASTAFSDAGWETVSVPHYLRKFNISSEDHERNRTEIGWYRRHFTIKAKESVDAVFLEFQGAMQVTDVWVNGRHAGQFAVSGFNSFHFDITSLINDRGKDNVIAVRVDNSENADIPPDGPKAKRQSGHNDFFLFGGLYRDVFLTTTGNLRITYPWSDAQAGIRVTTSDLSQSSATVSIEATVKNGNASSRECTVAVTIVDPSGAPAATMRESSRIAASAPHTFTLKSPAIPNPALWSPESPSLYKAVITINDGSGPVDDYATTLGMRRFEFDQSRGFLLNGKPYKLIGTNLHQFMPWVGNAVTNRYHRRRVDDIKSIGCNWIRLSHYPHDPDLLDHCDRVGLLCLAEGPTWMHEGNAAWWNNLEQSFRRMIRRDRNHPCIFIWNACINHSTCNSRLNDAAHEEDTTRPTGQCDVPAPMCFCGDNPCVPDNGALCIEHTGHQYAARRFDFHQNIADAEMLHTARQHWKKINAAYKTHSNAGVAGWCMYDYKSYHQASDPDIGMAFHGFSDIYLIPKYTWHWYRSELTEAPMVFVANSWRSQSPTDVTVFSNCDRVELLVNGTSAGTQSPDNSSHTDHLKHPPFTFTGLAYAEGEIVARGYVNGRPTTEHSVRTPLTAERLKLAADYDTLYADGADFTRVVVSQVDANGTVVPVAWEKAPALTLSITGPGSVIADDRFRLYGGQVAFLVKAGMQTGTMTATAKVTGLGDGTASIVSVKPVDDIATNVHLPRGAPKNSVVAAPRTPRTIAVYTPTGRRIRTVAAASLRRAFDAGNLPAGAYVCKTGFGMHAVRRERAILVP